MLGERESLGVVVVGAGLEVALTRTFPALFRLYCSGKLPDVRVVGLFRATNATSSEGFRALLEPQLGPGDQEGFLQRCRAVSGDYRGSSATAVAVSTKVADELKGLCRVLVYFMPALSLHAEDGDALAGALRGQCAVPGGFLRCIVEKNIGVDRASARALGEGLSRAFGGQDNVFRLDHFLGKDMVQNIVALRFANRFFEPSWNNSNVNAVVISCRETKLVPRGAEEGQTFDRTGIVREMLLEHLLHIMALVAMEAPVSLTDGHSLRDEVCKVMRCVRPVSPGQLVLGQYEGYRGAPGVAADSCTATFCTCVLYIDNPRWHGVPFILKAGKGMYERRTDVRVQFKPPHNALFPRANGGGVNNELVIRVQPNRDIYMKVSRKVAGRGHDVAPVKLDMLGSSHGGAVLALDRASGAGDDDDAAAGAAHGAAARGAGGALLAGLVGSNAYMPDSYELLLEDVIAGDLNEFTRADELDALWAVFDSALGRLEADAGAAQRRQLVSYKVGSRGPEASDELMARAGFVSYKLVGELLGGARGERSVMERLQRQFALSAYQMEEIAAAFERAFREGLRGAPGAAIKMLPSYVTRVPDGSERGVYYALDLGGTNFRVSRFLLDGKGGVSLTDERKHTVPDALMTGTAEQLFDFLAQCISSLSVPEPPGQERAYGFTFSFPVEQTAIDRGTLIKWTKGFTASGVVDQDVVQLLAAALRRRGHEGRIVALVNDTVGTLVSSAYGDPATMIGVILGTGTNAAYRERVDNITKLPQSMRARGGEMVVNTEWGNFGKGGQDLPMSEVDVELDARSRNKGDQLFEKMISGLYLGEIARCCLEKMHAAGEIWAAVHPAPQALSTKDAFLARYLSDIEYDLTPDLSIVQRTELAFGVKGSTLADRQKLKEVCGMVVQRAANLTACAIAAVVRRVGPERGQGCTVGVDGSVYQLHPSFRHRLHGALAEMAVQCNVVLAKDGSGKGSALIACGAVHDHAAR